jgi:hypothetical protein
MDVCFLAWLEGSEDRLPHIERLCGIPAGTFGRAIRAATWLQQFGFNGGLIAPAEAMAWRDRYATLLDFLKSGLSYSMAGRHRTRSADLQALEDLLAKLLPKSSRNQYIRDIRQLRKHGQPQQPVTIGGRRAGGRPESEETRRMRAAVEHLVSCGSKSPYVDLADFWTECARVRGAREPYDPENIRSRLRKGPPDERERGAVELEFWRAVYEGDFRDVFPGQFPLSPELALRRKAPR